MTGEIGQKERYRSKTLIAPRPGFQVANIENLGS
jgi:hypothetical protein